MKMERELFLACVKRLEDLPFVEKVALLPDVLAKHPLWDGVIRIATTKAKETFVVEVKGTHLTQTIVDGVLAGEDRYDGNPWLLVAPHVGRPLATYLDERDVNFVDLVGNCRLKIGTQYFAMIEGRPPKRHPHEGRGVGAAGVRVLFALLARPELLNVPVRMIAKDAGVATATAADRLVALAAEGLIHETRGHRKLTDPQRIFDRWLKGYEAILRPKLLIGRYRVQETDPEALERRIEETLGDDLRWGFGGGAAANRLTKYYRGEETVLHVEEGTRDVAKRLRALPAADGPLILMGAPGPMAFEGAKPRTVAPLLVYTELLQGGDKRATEAAAEVKQKYLDQLP